MGFTIDMERIEIKCEPSHNTSASYNGQTIPFLKMVIRELKRYAYKFNFSKNILFSFWIEM